MKIEMKRKEEKIMLRQVLKARDQDCVVEAEAVATHHTAKSRCLPGQRHCANWMGNSQANTSGASRTKSQSKARQEFGEQEAVANGNSTKKTMKKN